MNQQQFAAIFAECKDTAAIKTLFRKLAMTHHPDKGGDTATMQALNNAYQHALKSRDGRTERGTDAKERTYTYNQADEEAIAAKIAELIGLNMEGVEIWLIGNWVWVKGETKPHREKLGSKGAGLKWAPQREAWLWHLPHHAARRNNRASFEDLADAYGATQFRRKAPAAVTASR